MPYFIPDPAFVLVDSLISNIAVPWCVNTLTYWTFIVTFSILPFVIFAKRSDIRQEAWVGFCIFVKTVVFITNSIVSLALPW